jgi:hypothetical protein
MLNPDEEVQARIRLVFEKFRDIRSASGVMRSLRAAHLPLPARPRVGPAPYEVVWQPARTSAILDILHNPAYAGAYVYGRKQLDPARRTPAHPRGGRILQPIDKWDICLHNRYPAYIAWEEFVANQAQLHANSLNESRGATWDGTQRPSVAARDRALWALRSLAASALLWSRGANFLSIVVVPTRASLEEQTANKCVRWLWIRRSNSVFWRHCGQIN